MAASQRSLFLERRSYRRRRMMDAARILPLAGLFAFLMPLFWASGTGSAGSTAGGVIYVFGVWVGLIAVAAVMVRPLARDDETSPGDPARDPGRESGKP